MAYFGKVQAAADAVRARVSVLPSTAVVLGSGLGDFAGSLGDATSIPYKDLPNWPISSVQGHEGRLVVGRTHRRRCRRYVHGAGSDRRAAHGDRRPGHLVHHEHGRRGAAAAAESLGGHGHREARAGTVHRAAGGHHWPARLKVVCRWPWWKST